MNTATRWHPGIEVHDMHYRLSPDHADLETKDVVRFRLPPKPIVSFHEFLNSVCRNIDRFYTNKCLVIIDEADADGWFPAAWSYDGMSGGVCKVRPRQVTK